MRRLTLGFDMLAADLYWIRAVQHYGSTRLSTTENKEYELLYPLLDMTTTLDPHFRIAYRFGAILLSEPRPNGPGRPDQAIALLEKGIRQTPDRWEYYHDAGFVEYWWRQDFEKAAEWFSSGSRVPGAPEWLPQVAATVLAEGGARESARAMWVRMAEADQDWMRQAARRGLMRLDAEAAIEQLQVTVNRFRDDAGRFPAAWEELVRARRLPGIPLDPSGEPYAIDPESGAVNVAPTSQLFPLRIARIDR
jgi:tetratricopeptide (TPR) repeat protein